MKYWTLVYCFTKKLSKLAEGEQDKNFNIILDCLKKSVQLNSKSHKLRLHAGKYLALGQQNPVTVYRDNNKDGKYDLDDNNTQTGLYGINIHRATGRQGGTSTRVDKWSAGCQVIANNTDWHEFLDICYEAKAVWGNNFTYTLIESDDIA